ncbi:hypothetical protein [Phnomibacter ginsenosidimutans]|nr:hypothetical protein [Phnomibacter ginsenosidimutans]
MNQFLKIHPADNVWVALVDLPAGTVVQLPQGPLTLVENIDAKHKVF